MSSKADYVRTEMAKPQPRQHHCHWPGCTTQVHPAQWGCRPHWYTLPISLRNKVWAAFRPGQEKTLTPSSRYLEVAREVREWIQQHEAAKAKPPA